MYAPHKVKLAVSGCPRNCAEAGIKDVGVIGVDSGWEIYVAGNGGIKTEVAHFFTKVKTAEEVLEVHRRLPASCTAKKAGTWSAPCTTSNRVGLDYVKKKRAGRPRQPQGAVGAAAVCAGRRARPLVRLPDKAAVDVRQFIPIAMA
jgi:nitrite reductase (NADH) large subunit